MTWALATMREFRGFAIGPVGYGWRGLHDEERYSDLWRLLADYDEQAEADLNNLAAHYGIDRDAVSSFTFPKPVEGNPYPPTFCSDCLWWFDPPEEVSIEDVITEEEG